MKNLTLAQLGVLFVLALLLSGCNFSAKTEKEAAEVEVKVGDEATVEVEEKAEKPAIQTETNVEAEVKAEVSIAPRVISVSGDEYSFSPSSISVDKGEKVKVVFTNVGQGRHNWVIGGINLSTRTIGSNETDTLEFTAEATGTYEIFCSVAGHKEAGMVGSLTVK